jgi:MarR family 2-MHQ and catechol resistance regulon transcriptional repressor
MISSRNNYCHNSIPRVNRWRSLNGVDNELLRDERITTVGLFMEAHAGLGAALAAQVAEHGLSPVEFEVLARLGRSPGRRLRMTDLATQTLLSTSGLTRVADRLEKQGLLERTACAEDRRGTNAVLTDAGLQRLTEAIPDHLKIIDRWLTGLLDEDELGAFTAALRKIRDAVRPGATSGV